MIEREMFEDYIRKTYPLASLNKVYLNDDTYTSPQIDNMWRVWQASASRQGYKLVPVNNCKIITYTETWHLEV